MNNLEEAIANAKPEEIHRILQAVLNRYEELFPDWTVSTFSLCKKESRDEQIDHMIRLLERIKTSP